MTCPLIEGTPQCRRTPRKAESGTPAVCCASPMLCDVIASRSRAPKGVAGRLRGQLRTSAAPLHGRAEGRFERGTSCSRDSSAGPRAAAGAGETAEQRAGDVCRDNVAGTTRPRTFVAGSTRAGCASERSDRTARASAAHRESCRLENSKMDCQGQPTRARGCGCNPSQLTEGWCDPCGIATRVGTTFLHSECSSKSFSFSTVALTKSSYLS